LSSLFNDVVEGGDRAVRVDATFDEPAELFPGVLDDDVEQLQHLAVGGPVELEVERPDVIRSLGSEPVRRARRGPETPTLSLPVRYFQALLAPQTLDLLAVSVPAFVSQHRPRLAIAPALVLAAEGPESLS